MKAAATNLGVRSSNLFGRANPFNGLGRKPRLNLPRKRSLGRLWELHNDAPSNHTSYDNAVEIFAFALIVEKTISVHGLDFGSCQMLVELQQKKKNSSGPPHLLLALVARQTEIV